MISDKTKSPHVKSVLNEALFKELKEKAFSYWPTKNVLPKNYKSISLYDYSSSLVRANPEGSIQPKKQEYIEAIKQEILKILGEPIAESVAKQLEYNHSISTAQHFSPLTHPKTLNPTLQSSLPYFVKDDPAHQNVIVLSCSNISFDNSWFPRGLLFQSLMDDTIATNDLVFFPRKVRPLPVFTHSSYTLDSVSKMKSQVDLYFQENKINKNLQEHLHTLIDEVYGNSWVLNSKFFTDQVAKTDYLLWKKIFSGNSHIPNLVFISQEQIVIHLLKKYHLHKDTPIHQFLFNKNYYNLVDKYFNGIVGAFAYERNYGTYMLWGRPSGKKYREQLWRKGNALTTPDQSFTIPLTPDAIEEALDKHELIPSTMFSFIILSCYYGLILTGGLDQPLYLTQMKQAYMNVLRDVGDSHHAKESEQTPTNDITITRPTLAYIQSKNDHRVPATGISLAIYKNKDLLSTMLNSSKNITIDNALDRLLPNIYDEYCPKEKFNDKLAAISEEQIEKLTGLDKKIPAIATLE